MIDQAALEAKKKRELEEEVERVKKEYEEKQRKKKEKSEKEKKEANKSDDKEKEKDSKMDDDIKTGEKAAIEVRSKPWRDASIRATVVPAGKLTGLFRQRMMQSHQSRMKNPESLNSRGIFLTIPPQSS